MILQSILYPCEICDKKELYYQCTAELVQKDEIIILPTAGKVSFLAYMNMFDTKVWQQYTQLTMVRFVIQLSGKGHIALKRRTGDEECLITEIFFKTSETRSWEEINIDIDLEKHSGICYFEITADAEIQFRNARFETIQKPVNIVQIALNICTYHRNGDIQRNILQLKKSRFFIQGDELFQRLYCMVVDNGSELALMDEPNIKLVHNPNTGGSGGFKRGLEEIRGWPKDITHVVFMDDDVEFLTESLYRLYALLSFLGPEYRQESVAGRMFRTDRRWVQYTAAEIWNGGELKHIGFNSDMTQEQEILNANDNAQAEYGGWWFCCYPMEFARENDPLPFFIHCDDVEYGLRYGGTPIILNGIQVWHETYEYRQSAVIAYYDTRNSLIVNAMYGKLPEKEKLLADWKRKITEQHVKGDFFTERMIILGMFDFLTGGLEVSDTRVMKKHQKLLQRRKFLKIKNALLWRLSEKIILDSYKMKKHS